MHTSRPVGKAVPLVTFHKLSFCFVCQFRMSMFMHGMAWLGLYDTQLAFLRFSFYIRCCFDEHARFAFASRTFPSVCGLALSACLKVSSSVIYECGVGTHAG
jgi:hypothetical protein